MLGRIIGIVVTGIIGLILIILGFTDSAVSFICFAVGFIAGVSMLIIAGMKYNR